MIIFFLLALVVVMLLLKGRGQGDHRFVTTPASRSFGPFGLWRLARAPHFPHVVAGTGGGGQDQRKRWNLRGRSVKNYDI